MKKLIITLITLTAVTALTACGKTDTADTDTNTDVSATTTVASEISTDISSESTDVSSEIPSEIAAEIPPVSESTENASENSTEVLTAVSTEAATEQVTGEIAKYVGDWTMNGGNGINIMHIDENGTVVHISANGEYYTTYSEAYADKIVNIYNDYDAYSFENNTLVDMAGYRYFKTENLVVDVMLYNYVGVWTMDGGIGVNTLHIFPNGTWHQLYADGTEINGKLTASEYGVVFDDAYGNSMAYQGGNLIDMAGYSWQKTSTSVF